jgi:hypothetical protein
MTEPLPGCDRGGRAERQDRAGDGRSTRIRPFGRRLSVVGGTDQPEAAEVASGITPAEAELLGDYTLHNG